VKLPALLHRDAFDEHVGGAGLSSCYEELLRRVRATEPGLRALLPEQGRRKRIMAEVGALEVVTSTAARRGPVHGLPLGVKDVLRVDGLETRAGSALPPECFLGEQAVVVTRAREHGAVVLGKTTSAEFACFEPCSAQNPRARGHTPGGSSSGSAAAVAAGFAACALGTQTVGSVIRPAAYCGVAACVPSRGRISNVGVVPYSPTIDLVGYLVPGAGDLAVWGAALLDDWAEGAASRPPPSLAVLTGGPLEFLEAGALASFEASVARLQRAGLRVEPVELPLDHAELVVRHQELIFREFSEVHERWYAEHGALYRPISAEIYERGAALSPQVVEVGKQSMARTRSALEGALQERGLDAWFAPSAPGPAPAGLGSTGNPVMSLAWTHAGLPQCALPSGELEGRPVGVQLIGAHGSDEACASWAEQLARVLDSASSERAAGPPGSREQR